MGRVTKGVYRDLTGMQFGKWTALRLGRVVVSPKGRRVVWVCRCACGTEKEVSYSSLVGKRTQSCGCSRRDRPPGQSGMRLAQARYRSHAKQRGYEWTLSEMQFAELTSANCSYCGIAPAQVAQPTMSPKSTYSEAGIAHARYLFNGIDRVNNNRGYVPDNCVTCCGTCNLAKRTMSVDEFLAWADRIAAFRAKEAS